MKLPIFLVVISLIMFYFIVPILIWFFARKSKVGKIIVIIFSISFCIILFFGITSKIVFTGNYALIDIDYSYKWCCKTIKFSLNKIDKVDFLINIVMLIPIGLVVVFFNKKCILNKFINLLFIGVLFGIMLETIQYILPVYRSVQLSDVLLNTISVIIGGCLGMLYDIVLSRIKK